MMKKITLLILFLLCILVHPEPISAHILSTDGSVGAVLHVDPEDDPIVGQQSNFFFEFKDQNRKFSPDSCECFFSVLEGGKEIFSQPLFQTTQNPSLTNISVAFTFPQKDVYTVKVSGTAKNSTDFSPFMLSYDIRVSREDNPVAPDTNHENEHTNILYYVIAIGSGIFLGGLIFGKRKNLFLLVIFCFICLHVIPGIFILHSHQQKATHDHPCCMPQAVVVPSLPVVIHSSARIASVVIPINIVPNIFEKREISIRAPPRCISV